MGHFGVRIYLQSDGETVQVIQTELSKDTPEYVPILASIKFAKINDTATIGELVKNALTERVR